MATTTNGIYYPNDYNSAADIPADLKKMAESINKNIQDNKYDDSEIKQDIQELQSKNEEQDEKIETIETEQLTQNDLIERTKDALINITTEKSDNIHVEDSSNLTAKIDAFGTSSQETRSGKNKFNVSNLSGSSITDKDFDTSSFILQNTWANQVMSNANLIKNIKPSTQYICTADVTLLEKPEGLSESANHSKILTIYKNGTSTLCDILKTSTTEEKSNWQVNTTKKFNISFTTPSDLTDYRIIGYTYYTSSQVAGKFKIKNMMIREATEDDEFEIYGASPSPEFPSEIENVTGDIDITVCNKNLGNAELLYNQMKFFRSNSVRKEIVDGKECIVFNNSMFRSAAGFKGLLGRYRKQTRYVIRGKFKVYDTSIASGYQLYLNAYNSKDEVIGSRVLGADGENWVQFSFATNSGSDFDYIAFSYGNSALWCLDMDSLEIYEGTSAEECAKNEEQLITFPFQENQRMCDKDYLASDGIHHKRKQIEFDGTENWKIESNNAYITISDALAGRDNNIAMSTHFKYDKTASKFEYMRFGASNNNLIILSAITNFGDLASFKEWLSQQKQAGTPIILEYELAEEEIEEYTEEQQEAYNKLQNVLSYKTVTNVFTNQGLLEFKYVADTETWVINEIKPLKEQISTINELLSTTGTSALLLDNMQTDLESEVI